MPPAAVPFVVGAAAIGAGIATTGVVVLGVSLGATLITLGVSSTIQGALGLLQGGGADLNRRQGQNLTNRVDPQNAVPVVYGNGVKVGIEPADIRVDPNSDDRRELYYVGAFSSAGRNGRGITNVSKVWFDETLAIDGPAFGSDITTGWQDPFKGKFRYGLHDGTQTSVDSKLNSVFPTAWDSSHVGFEIAYIWFRLSKADDQDDKVFRSIPNVTMLVDGVEVFDTRDSTWKNSDNPALIIRDFLLATEHGLGAPSGEIDDSAFETMANLYEEDPSPNAAQRFTCNGALDTSQSLRQNLADLLTSCRGQLIYQNGQFRLFTKHGSVTASTFELDEDNILDGTWKFHRAGISGSATSCKAQYIDPDQDHRVQSVIWPNPRDSSADTFVNEDNGFRNQKEINLPFTQDSGIAKDICQTLVKEARQDLSVEVTANEEALKLQVGDVVKVTHSTPDWSGVEFWVDAVSILPPTPDGSAGGVRLVLTEFDSNAYSLSTTVSQTPPPPTDLPDPFTIGSVQNLTLTSDNSTQGINPSGNKIPRILATWDPPANHEGFYEHADVFARQTKDAAGNAVSDTYEHVRRVEATDAQKALFAVGSEDQEWEVKVMAASSHARDTTAPSAIVILSTDYAADDLDDAKPTVDIEPVRADNPFKFKASIVGSPGPDGNSGQIEVAWRLDDPTTGEKGTFSAWAATPVTAEGFRDAYHDKVLVAKARDVGFASNPESDIASESVAPFFDRDDLPGQGRGPLEDDRSRDGFGGETPGSGRQKADVYDDGGTTRLIRTGARRLTQDVLLSAGVQQTDGARQGPINKLLDAGQDQDAASVNFSESYQSTPIIYPYTGWVTYDAPNLDETKGMAADVKPVNASPSGFELSARVKETDITVSTQSISMSTDTLSGVGINDNDYSAEKTDATDSSDAWNDEYVFIFDAQANGVEFDGECFGGSIEVGFYTNDGGGWVLHDTYTQTANCSNTSVTDREQTIVKSGLGTRSGPEFAMGVESETGNGGSYTGKNVEWETATDPASSDATQNGDFAAKWAAFAKS